MPWYAKLIYEPKLAGGFKWQPGHLYRVEKKLDSDNMVLVTDQHDNYTVIHKREAIHLFSKPQWSNKPIHLHYTNNHG
jgi:hypothetical protein